MKFDGKVISQGCRSRALLLVVAIKAGKTKPHCSLFYDLVSLRSTASWKEATPPTTPPGKKRRWM